MDSNFSLNVNKIGGDVKVTPEAVRTNDADIYDLRRQIEARQVIKDYVRTEVLRLQQLLEQLNNDIISIDLKLRDRKPAGEPNNKRFLYAPGTTYELKDGEGNSVEGEIV